MIPSIIDPHTASPGEREIFQRLRDDPDTSDWVVLHSLVLSHHVRQLMGEVDGFEMRTDQLEIVIGQRRQESIGWTSSRGHGCLPEGSMAAAGSLRFAMYDIRRMG